MKHGQIQIQIQDALIAYYNSIGFKYATYLDLWEHLKGAPAVSILNDVAAALEINKIPCGCY